MGALWGHDEVQRVETTCPVSLAGTMMRLWTAGTTVLLDDWETDSSLTSPIYRSLGPIGAVGGLTKNKISKIEPLLYQTNPRLS